MISHQFGLESDVEEEEEPTLPSDIHDVAVAFLSDKNRRFLLNRAEEVLAAVAQKATDSDFTFAEFFAPPRMAREAPRYGFRCVAFRDRVEGWEAVSIKGQADFWDIHTKMKALFMVYSPPCTYLPSSAMHAHAQAQGPQGLRQRRSRSSRLHCLVCRGHALATRAWQVLPLREQRLIEDLDH